MGCAALDSTVCVLPCSFTVCESDKPRVRHFKISGGRQRKKLSNVRLQGQAVVPVSSTWRTPTSAWREACVDVISACLASSCFLSLLRDSIVLLSRLSAVSKRLVMSCKAACSRWMSALASVQRSSNRWITSSCRQVYFTTGWFGHATGTLTTGVCRYKDETGCTHQYPELRLQSSVCIPTSCSP